MNAYEPHHVRHRGYFLSRTDETGEPESGETESPEGFTFRVRIVRPLRQRAAATRRAAARRRFSQTTSAADRQQSADSRVKSATETGIRQP